MAKIPRFRVIAGIVIAAVLAAAWLILDRPESGAARQGTDDAYVQADATVVAPQVAGLISRVAVADNQEVRAGAPLVELDDRALRIAVANAQAAIASLQAQIERQAASRDLERYQRGFDGGAVAQVDVAKAQDGLRKADIELQHAQQDARLQGQGADLDARNKRLLADRQRSVVTEVKRQVDALTLRAPFDGQVGQVQAVQHTQVIANAPVLGVVDLSKFEVEIKVPESFARDLAIGMPAQLTSGSGEPFPGEISAVSPEVVNGEVTARIRFSDKQPPGLRQSQRMSARVLLGTRKNVLKLERGPFVEQSGGRYAYVMNGKSAVRRPVQLGLSSLGEVEVLSGLQPGERVVVSGSDLFGDAVRVTIH